MKTLTTRNPFWELDEVQNRLGSFFAGLPTRFGNGNGESLKQKKKYHRIERSYGSFLRTFTVPEDADGSKVADDFKEGMLKMRLPKQRRSKSRCSKAHLRPAGNIQCARHRVGRIRFTHTSVV